MKTTDKVQEEIIEEFDILTDWLDKYEAIIDMGNNLPIIDPRYKTNEYVINGCQSKVWLNADYQNGHVMYYADSDAIITKGIISLLIKVLSDRTPKEVLDTNLYFIEKIGLKENLSPTRANGLLAMIKQMKLYALAYAAKYNEKEKS